MSNNRFSGVLCHITSLPNDYMAGTLGNESYRFVDLLKAGGFSCWQVLPITDCGYLESPYNSNSTFALNPFLIDLTEFFTREEIYQMGFDKSREPNYNEDIIRGLFPIIYERNKDKFDTKEFERENAYWLDDYALYETIQVSQCGKGWGEWPKDYKDKNPEVISKFKKEHTEEIAILKFIQYIANYQWDKLRKYANEQGIKLFGDVTYYVSLDSCEVWSNPENWQLKNGKPEMVAGVPPDYFNENGQLWGNPIYDFDNMKKNGYKFFVDRFKRLSKLFDIVRIDHFVALYNYWAIPSTAKTAKEGRWIKNVGEELLTAIIEKCDIELVAEDLGIVTDGVTALRKKFNISGLKVLQFAFDDEDNMYQPHNYEKDCIAYIGTHDNNTFMGMLNEGDWNKINKFKRYLQIPLHWGNDAVVDQSIIALYRSSANGVILTMQDILKLDASARMNVPGVGYGNWQWQMNYLPDTRLMDWYRDLSNLYCR